MIVQCQECSTKFRLDDSKVGESGVKVRCAKCRHIFVVRREQPAEEPDVDTMLQGLGAPGSEQVAATPVPPSSGPSIEMDDDLMKSLAGAEGEERGATSEFSFDMPEEPVPPAAGAGGVSEFEFDDSSASGTAPAAGASFEPPPFQEFSFDLPEATGGEQPSGLSVQEPQEEQSSIVAEEVSFSFGETPLADVAELPPAAPVLEPPAAPAPFISTGVEPPQFSFDSFAEPADSGVAIAKEAPPAPAPSPGDEFIFGSLSAPPAEEDKFSFASPVVAGSVTADAFSFNAPPAAPAEEPPRAASEDVRSLFSQGGEAVTSSPIHEPLVFGGEGESDGDAMPPLSIASRKRGGISSVMRLLILLPVLLAVIAGGGWWYVQQHGVASLEGVLSAVGVDMAPRFELSGVRGSYAAGVDGVQLFVIQGEVRNLSRFARGEVQVRGGVYGAGNRQLMTKTVFCGNPLSAVKLATLPLADIEKAMGNRFGEGLSNLEVKGGASIPFTVVFVSPPLEAVDYGVEMAGSVLAQKKKE